MTIHLKFIIVLFNLFFLFALSPAQDIDEMLGFAKSLYVQGDYYRAITEYKRVLFFSPAESTLVREKAVLGIGGALFSGREYARSGEWLNTHLSEFKDTEQHMEATRLMCRGFLRAKSGSRLTNIIVELNDSSPEIQLYAGLAYASIGSWQKASLIFQKLSKDNQFGQIAKNYNKISVEGEQAAWKSPKKASFLNIIPGIGYWYAGHKQTAVASFIVNTVFIGATIQAFKTNQNILGGFLSLFSISWYAGNIYGAVKATQRYNDNLQEKIWTRFIY